MGSFKLPGMEYSSTLSSHLAGIRKIAEKYISQAIDDKQDLVIDIRNHLPPTYNSRVEPQCNGYEAQRLLNDEIEAGKHLRMKPKELHETRDE